MSSDQGQQLDLFDDQPVTNRIDLFDTIDLSDISFGSMADTITLGSLSNTAPSISISNGGIDPYSFSYTPPNTSLSNKLSVNGPDADIEINGESVVGILREIRDRLNILQVSKDMEQEWDDLRVLREQYEAKLEECREKSRAWTALQQMPAAKNPG
jgi:hypothetical protein